MENILDILVVVTVAILGPAVLWTCYLYFCKKRERKPILVLMLSEHTPGVEEVSLPPVIKSYSRVLDEYQQQTQQRPFPDSGLKGQETWLHINNELVEIKKARRGSNKRLVMAPKPAKCAPQYETQDTFPQLTPDTSSSTYKRLEEESE